MKQLTKLALSQAIRDLMDHYSLSEIRVTEICEKAGVDRHTFYYHFKDKYDLVAWIYSYSQQLATQQTNGFMGLEESILALSDLKNYRQFYKKAFEDVSVNALSHYIVSYNVTLYAQMIKQTLQVDELDEILLQQLRYHCYGCLGLSQDWIQNNCEMDCRELALQMTEFMPPILKDVVMKTKP
ncbi:TetR/AcrR family transcriptional regulator C-terminal domain-containing protein [Streptococcus moroccensis]|uniref:AcrR family transcriptional regulator n=1 Tax=Streptococcus moroccensis TaxID=1451356 RepID=A0ABT9YR44_9STRE|nr:TetR/AcrR family transcriptional regulator C-terminal domain-containing protein [Streptococcus moroccensis]MDQ0222240.1 AcrR family transcriptional regulator [Streptococcus moroccensis]